MVLDYISVITIQSTRHGFVSGNPSHSCWGILLKNLKNTNVNLIVGLEEKSGDDLYSLSEGHES